MEPVIRNVEGASNPILGTEDGVPNLGKGEWKTDTLSGRYERLAVPLGDEEGVVQQLAVCIDRL